MLMVQLMSSKEWQAGRNRFNHDWLKNKFLLSLDRMVKIAEDKIEDDGFSNRFVAGALRDWEMEATTALELIESFEVAMSPCMYLDREPLCRSTQRDWLRGVVHELWRSRVGVSNLLSTAREKVHAASKAYDDLCRCVEGQSGEMDCSRLACCRTELVEFRDRCRELASAFEKFPHRVLVA